MSNSIRPPSWRPTEWQARFVGSNEPRIALEGHTGCGKERTLIEAAAYGIEDPVWRAVIIVIGDAAKAEMVRATEGVYGRLPASYAGEFWQWTFLSGAIVRIAGSIQEARASAGYDAVCLHHLEEFRFGEIAEAQRLLRRAPGRTPRLRATHRIDRDWRRFFPARITFDGSELDPLFGEPSPEATDLERLVIAVTHHQHSHGGADADTWAAVLDAIRVMSPGPHDAETSALVKAIETVDGDGHRMTRALERARHHLAEMQGADPGACHATCPPSCYLRRSEAGYSVDITSR